MVHVSPVGIFVILVVIVAIVIVFKGVKQVPQGYQWTVERFGRYTKTLSPGLALIMPFIDGVGYKINMKEQVLDVPAQEVISSDNATVTVNGVVFFQVMDAPKSAYEVNNLDFAMTNLVVTNLRTVLGAMELDKMLSQRDSINAKLLSVVDHATNPWGVKVTRIEIKDITPPKDITEAMARQMKAEREKRAAILEAEGLRQSEILKAEGEKQSIILKNEADKQATILQAEGDKEAAFRDAEARERIAKAEAFSTDVVSKAIEDGSIQSINYFIAQRYIDALGKVASADNQKVVLMPLEAASVIGSVAGIAEIAKEALGNKK
jgi:regulator of protease activity HflC (stomatin/prohibitin superfamily)